MKLTLRQRILGWLARRDHSQQEVLQKLQAKGYETAEAEAAVTLLVQDNFINDQRFATHFIEWRRAKGYGPKRIIMELKARGITDEMIAELLNITDNAWSIAIRNTWQKRFKNKPPNDYAERAKQFRFLYQRGYTQAQIETLYAKQSEHDDY